MKKKQGREKRKEGEETRDGSGEGRRMRIEVRDTRGGRHEEGKEEDAQEKLMQVYQWKVWKIK